MSSKILIVGGSGGIGESLIRLLDAKDGRVAFTFCSDAANAEKIEKSTGARKIAYDQNSEKSLSELAQTIRSGSFDSLVLIAGEPVERESFLKTDPAKFLRYVSQGLMASVTLAQAFAQEAKKRKSPGSIVIVLSSYVLGFPPEKLGSYVTLKHALLGLSRSLAVELIKDGVRVNCVSPGVTKTDFISDLPERFIQIMEEGLPMQRIAKPEEVAKVIRFLISEESSYVNGANLPVTGGTAC